MKIVRTLGVLKRQIVYSVAAVALLLSVALPSLVSAAQLTDRSVQLSSSSKSATGVNYLFSFTAAATAGAVVVQFCDNSPLVGEVCDAPAGMSATGATASGGATIHGTPTANTVKVTDSITAGTNTFTIGNITNPSSTGTIYARVLTYADGTASDTYSVDGTTSTLGSPIDQGSVALAITDTVSVSGAVLESLLFCVAGNATAPATDPIGAGCTGANMSAPTLKLGEETLPGVFALDANHLSTGKIYTQISTNAIQGAVVNLKSSTTGCGGLALNGTGACNILPAGSTGTFALGTAKVGVHTDAANTDSNGTVKATGVYDSSNYRLNYVSGDTSGVTGPYGDPILTTDDGGADKTASSKNMPLTFGASIANNTPAGKYSADYSLIATGTF